MMPMYYIQEWRAAARLSLGDDANAIKTPGPLGLCHNSSTRDFRRPGLDRLVIFRGFKGEEGLIKYVAMTVMNNILVSLVELRSSLLGVSRGIQQTITQCLSSPSTLKPKKYEIP